MNNFDFAGKLYLQVGGTAMGTKVAPSFANTFMGWFERKYVYTYHKQPLIWVRFIDDIFQIWPHGMEEFKKFEEHLNNCVPSIKFETEISVSSVHFLDTTVSIDNVTNTITASLYTKPTDSHSYLSYTSCHPIANLQYPSVSSSDLEEYVARRRTSSIMLDKWLVTSSKPNIPQTLYRRALVKSST